MGAVWEGEHTGLKTNVAVKFVLGELGDSEEALTRFAREATATARIRSPHVVQVFDHGKNEEGLPYMVMEFLEGEDLEARLERDGKLAPPLVFQIVLQAAKALAKAHDLGIVHRDMKPSNVFLTDLEGEVFVKILDFGIAKMSSDDPSRMSMTQTGAVIGTPYFMAPEQMTSAKDAGPVSDVWSLGVIGYRALTGRLPYESDTLAGLAMAIERGNFPKPSSLVNDLPPGIDAWFAKALAKDPADRYATIRDMSEELGRIVRTQVGGHVLTSSSPPPSMKAASPQTSISPTSAADLKMSSSGISNKALGEAKTSPAMMTTLNRPLTEMSSTQALAARQSRGSGRRIVVVGVVAAVLGSLGALGWFLYASSQQRQGTATQPSAKPEKSASAKPVKLSADPVPSTSAEPEMSAEPIPSEEPSASAEPPSSASAPPSASAAPPVPPRPQPPRPPGTAPATASAKPPASATPPASAKPPASSSAPKPPASAPAPKASGAAK